MKLYYSKGSCSLAIRILVHELKINCAFEAVNLRSKQTASGKDFKSINPKGSVPALELDTQEIITENPAIQQYLADNYNGANLLAPVPELKRYRVIEWLNFISAELHKSFSPLFNPTIPEAIKLQYYIPVLVAKLEFLNHHLSEHEYLANNQFTLVDSYLFVLISWLAGVGLDIQQWPHLAAHHQRISQRPAVQQALTEEQLI